MKNPIRVALPVLAVALLLGCDLLAPKSSPSSSPASTAMASAGFVADHSSINASILPDSAVAAVKALDIYFEHASVGGRISGGPYEYVRDQKGGLNFLAEANSRYALNCLHLNDNGNGPLSSASAWADANAGLVENMRGNPSDFMDKITLFDTRMRAGNLAAHFDIAMFKLCWIDTAGSAQAAFDAARSVMEGLEASYPGTVFVWWTQPITTEGGDSQANNQRRDAYNALVRNYCAAHGKYLFDIADIEAHDAAGNLLVDGNGNFYLDSNYTEDGGHPNEACSTMLANAWWILMARISGWKP